MYVFKETQKFRQWWIYFIVVFTAAGIILNLYQETDRFTDFSDLSFLFLAMFFTAIITYFFSLQLKTKIDRYGIKTEFRPLPFFKREYKWDEIATCHVRKYSAIKEFGGWGIKGLFPAKAYTVRGSYGIQIVTKENVRFLIGTQEPQKAKTTIKRYMAPQEN